MENSRLLMQYFEDSGKTKTRLAEKMNVSRPRLDTILEDPETATVFQAWVLTKELQIKKEDEAIIFFPVM